MSQAQIEATRGQVAAVSFTTATTSVIVWGVNKFVFGGQIPPEIHGWLQLGVPLGMGYVTGEVQQRRARARVEAWECARYAGLIDSSGIHQQIR